MKELYDVAKQFGMSLVAPCWPEDRNGWKFSTNRMNDDSTWISHMFYLATSAEDCIERKLAAFAAKREEPEEDCWYPCAQECGAQVRVAGALCEACQACEELGFL